jgi:hypothetical protein
MLSQLHTSYALHLVFDFFTILFPGWCTRILWSGCKFPKRILLHTSCTKGKNSRAAYDLIFLFPSIPSQFLDIFLFSHHYFFFNFISKSDLFLAKMFLLLHLIASCSTQTYCKLLFQVPHLLQVVTRRRIKSNLSRKNILYRDNYTCQ